MSRAWLALLVLLCSTNLCDGKELSLVANMWEPFTGDKIVNQGFASHLVREALKVKGYQVDIAIKPWARVQKDLRTASANIDGVVAIWATSERNKYVHYSDAYYVNELCLAKHTSTSFVFKSLFSLTGKVVGVGRGYDYSDAIQTSTHFIRAESANLLHNLQRLEKRRIDLVLTDCVIGQHYLQKFNDSQQLQGEIDFADGIVEKTPLYFGTPKYNRNSKKLIADFNSGLAEIRNSGTLKGIFDAWHITMPATHTEQDEPSTDPVPVSIIKLYPWGFIDETTGQINGIHVEILKHLSTQTGIAFEPALKPYARVEKDIIEGKTPFSFLAADRQNFRDYAEYGQTLITLNFGIAYQSDGDGRVLSSFAGKDIGVPRGLKISPCFSSEISNRTEVSSCNNDLGHYFNVPVSDYTMGLKLLASDKLDGVLGSIPTIKTILATKLYDPSLKSLAPNIAFVNIQKIPIKLLYTTNNNFNFDKKRIDDAAFALTQKGEIRRIYRKFTVTKD